MNKFSQISITLNEYNHNLSGIGLVEYSFFEQESRLKISVNNIIVNELTGNRAIVAFENIIGNRKYSAKISIEDLETIAAKCCGTTILRMKENTKDSHIVFSRWLVWDYIVKYLYPKEFTSLQKIADLYAKDHASVLHGVKTLKERQFGWRLTAVKEFWETLTNQINKNGSL